MKKPESQKPPVEKPEVVSSPGDRLHPDGALDDPIHEFWTEHGKSIITGAVILVLGTALIFGVRAYRQIQEQTVRAAYTEAIADNNLAGFATDNTGHKLAGVAAMQVANRAYAEQDWEKAAEFYQISVDSLGRSQISGKARLGLGVTLSKLGNTEQSERVLRALAEDNRAMISSRATALYNLAILYFSQNEVDKFSNAYEKLSELDPRSYWQDKLRFYREHVNIPVDESIPLLDEDDFIEEGVMEQITVPMDSSALEGMELQELPIEE